MEGITVPEEFKFVANTGSIGYRVLDRHEPSTCYGIVWQDWNGCEWVAQYPGSRPGDGGGIPGFTGRMWAARFLYRYHKPEPSGRP
ncbi:hypothetical protein ACWEV9_32725 [Streptomyces albogriseolus]|uniref:hypothetical protein n=1 Tax=Streptomyces TaxID=1883 RepID=UPI0033A814AC